MDYQNSQWGLIWIPTLAWFVIIIVLIAALGNEEATASLVVSGAFMVLIMIVVLWFSRLTVAVGSGEVRVHFGTGWPRRVISVHDIVGFRPVRNRWYYGWGMRRTPGGWMFNVWGLDAIELELADGKSFRIGSNDLAGLSDAVRSHTALRPG